MVAFTSIALAGLALGAIGTGVSMYGASKAASAQQQQIAIEREMEAKRQQQLNLDAQRRKREIIRQSIVARGAALSVATNQGAAYGSGLQGAYGNVAGRTGVNLLGVNQNQEIGNAMFGLNENLLSAKSAEASASATAAFGSSLGSLGGAILKNSGTIARVGNTFASSFSGGFG